MWDPERKVGVLNDFDLSKLVGRNGASGKENMGTLPFMALELLSEEGVCGKIARLYRHDAESFFWSLIYLCISTGENEEGEHYIRTTYLLRGWSVDWLTSLGTRMGFKLKDYDDPKVVFAYPNSKILAARLQKYWLDRYHRSKVEKLGMVVRPSIVSQLGFPANIPGEASPYVEDNDDMVFRSILVLLAAELVDREELEEINNALVEMCKGYKEIDWSG